MAVINTETGIVHKGDKGGKTGCGKDTNENPDIWRDCSYKKTCNKSGCRN